MLISCQWLKEWVPGLPAPAELAKLLTARGFMVEGIHPQARFEGVVVGKVLENAKHPNADRLSVNRVDLGGGRVVDIVCGAPNARAGITVAVAVDGARLAGGVLKKSKIRGVVSNGMMCSARELELSEEHAGILELDASIPAGADFAQAAGLDDVILDIETPNNRGDLLCVRGMAREVAAALGTGPVAPWPVTPAGAGALPGVAAVDIEDPADCPRYAARVVEGITVGPSPQWIVRRLNALGMRSVNNVVDATNYVMLELGQPIHAFDLSKVRGARLAVRRARSGEKLRTLDGVDRELGPEVLLIADPEGPLALAGLMGGEDSEVREGTKSVLLESATFAGPRVRRGARSLSLASEAARRFERGSDLEAVPFALDRVAALIAELAHGRALPGALDAHVAPATPRRVAVRRARASMIMAVEFSQADVERALASLGFRATGPWAGDALEVEVPSWRVDVVEEIDLVEEVGRSAGYDGIPADPGSLSPLSGVVTPEQAFDARIRERLLGLGFHEAVTPTLIGPDDTALAADAAVDARESCPRLANPMSREFSLLRPSLLPGLLRSASRNLRHGSATVRLFETGRVFGASGGPLPEEALAVGCVLAGARHASGFGLGADLADFHDFKGLLESLLEALSIDTTEYVAYDAPGYRRGHAAEVRAGGKSLGVFGEVDPAQVARLEVSGPIYAAAFRVGALRAASRPAGGFRDWPKFPGVKRDLAFLVGLEVPAEALLADIRDAAGALLRRVELFDVYSGERVPKGLKNLAFSLEFVSPERTLADADVEEALQAAVARLKEKHRAELRA